MTSDPYLTRWNSRYEAYPKTAAPMKRNTPTSGEPANRVITPKTTKAKLNQPRRKAPSTTPLVSTGRYHQSYQLKP